MSFPEYFQFVGDSTSGTDAAEYRDTLQKWIDARKAVAEAFDRLVDYWRSGIVDPAQFESIHATLHDLDAEQFRLFGKLREITARRAKPYRQLDSARKAFG